MQYMREIHCQERLLVEGDLQFKDQEVDLGL